MCLADVAPEEVRWLWHPYIPLGKLTLLEGHPGEGKSHVALAIATALSRGVALLGQGVSGGQAAAPASVVVLSAEDGVGDTIRPRINAMEADVGRIHVVKNAVAFDEAGLASVDAFVAEHRPVLVVIDPLFAYVGAKADVYRPNEMRAVTARLAALAEQHGCAILALRHLTKSDLGAAILRGLGSIDLAAAARSVLLAGEDPNAPGRRAIVHIKSNLAPKGKVQGYAINEGRFAWTGLSTLTANAILSPQTRGPGERAPSLHEAKEFLEAFLADGTPKPAREVYEEARRVGITKRTLQRAAEGLGIEDRKAGFQGETYWELPPKAPRVGGTQELGAIGGSEGQQAHEQDVPPVAPTMARLALNSPMVNHVVGLGAVITAITPADQDPHMASNRAKDGAIGNMAS